MTLQGSVAESAHVATPVTAYPDAGTVYGLQPGSRQTIAALACNIERMLNLPDASDPQNSVATMIAPVLAAPDLLSRQHQEGDDHTYRRHVLYADPQCRFTILSLVWGPGHVTPVHGHTAWGAVGVIKGTPTVELFDCCRHDDMMLEFRAARSIVAAPGDTCTVASGIDDVHRIRNDTDETVITLHVYGRDLLRDPQSINIALDG